VTRRARLMVGLILLAAAAGAAGVATADGQADGLAMSKPVVCKEVFGFARFEELPGASLTADDKLTVYYEPTGYTIERTKDGHRALLRQDGRVRRKGSKDPLWSKEKMIEYEAKAPSPPDRLFMRSDVSIKGLPPGDYELDLTLRDALAKDAATTRSVGFKVIPAKADREATAPPASKPDDAPKAPEAKAKGPRRKPGEAPIGRAGHRGGVRPRP